MPKINKSLNFEITPEQFLNACSLAELLELDILLSNSHYQNRMNLNEPVITCIHCGGEVLQNIKTDEFYCTNCETAKSTKTTKKTLKR